MFRRFARLCGRSSYDGLVSAFATRSTLPMLKRCAHPSGAQMSRGGAGRGERVMHRLALRGRNGAELRRSSLWLEAHAHGRVQGHISA